MNPSRTYLMLEVNPLPILDTLSISHSTHCRCRKSQKCFIATAMATSGYVVPVAWAEIPSNMSFQHISTDGQRFCGVTTDSHEAFCWGIGARKEPRQSVAQDVVAITVLKDSAWTVDRYNVVRSRNVSENGSWKRLENGWARSVATDGAKLCVIWLANEAFCFRSNFAEVTPTKDEVDSFDALALDIHDGVVFSVHPNGSTAYLPPNASYPSSAGPYQSISSDSTFVCASKTKTDIVYCVEKTQKTWHPIGGRLRQVVVRDGRLYGVASNGSLWTTALKATSVDDGGVVKRLEAEEKAEEASLPAVTPHVVIRSEFKRSPSEAKMNQISFDGEQLCCVAPSNAAFCLTVASKEWRSIPKSLKSISVQREILWGIDTNNDLVWALTNDTRTWQSVPRESKVSQGVRVAGDGTFVCVLDNAGDAYCAKENIFTTPKWLFVGTDLKDIGVADKAVYGVAPDGLLYSTFPSTFPSLNQSIVAVASDGEFHCVSIPDTLEVLCSTRNETSWRTIGGNLSQLSIVDGKLFGLARDGSVWSTKLAVVTEEEAHGADTGPLPDVSKTGSSLSASAIAGIAIGSVIVLIGGLFIAYRLRRRGKQNLAEGNLSPKANTDAMPNYSIIIASPHTVSTDHAASSTSNPQEVMVTDWTRDEMMLAMQIPLRQIEFQDQISRGAFGDIYRGVYDNRVVAIKRLSVDRRRDLHEIAKLAQEARFLMRLQHERIVEFVGVAWNAPSDLCIVTEFVLGGDLLSWLQSCRAENRPEGFSLEKLKIALHVAHALTYLHSLQPIVLHRDLKSKNILLTETGDAKLTDFGVSREMEDATMTAGVGSSLWMAPEVIQGERYDEKADIYSFGVVLSELDTNELPFARARACGLFRSESIDADHISEIAMLQLVTLGKVAPRFTGDESSGIYALARSCVALEPHQRPSAAEALDRIHRVFTSASDTD